MGGISDSQSDRGTICPATLRVHAQSMTRVTLGVLNRAHLAEPSPALNVPKGRRGHPAPL
jgi:hypothetical protein